jgi:alpha-N-acetylglucosaminidase
MLDWMALHGINLPLAWFSPASSPSLTTRLGYEEILNQLFLGIGLTSEEIATFLSGPAFLSWNRFGNIQGTWTPANTSAPPARTWSDREFTLSQQIISRMVDLGMRPVLPAFTGFVPENITRVRPNATVVRGSEWNGFGTTYSNVTFLEPNDPLFAELQARLMGIQREVYGDVTDVYTLDQYNENVPFSGDTGYLANISRNTMDSLRAANPDAVWLMQVTRFRGCSNVRGLVVL